jgi:hypothetical protein
MRPHPRGSPRIVIALAAIALVAGCDHYAVAQTANAPSLAPAPSPAPVPAVDPCASPAVGVPVTVELARRSDGTCAPLGTAFVYRCDPALPAVAVIDDGRGIRRFIGGSYAVAMTSLPPSAFAIGVTGFGALYEDPSDPRYLWVEADGGVMRWLAIPNRNKLADPVTVQMIGDSILDGGQTAVIDGLPGWQTTIDAIVGRGSDGAAGAAEALPLPTTDAVVIEIGVNDHSPDATAANAQRIVDALGEARVLVWLTAHGPDTTVPAINQAIEDTIGRIPNGTVLDWNELVPLDALNSDGVHPDDQTVLASILDPFLQTWRDAVQGLGPTACEQTIRGAA